MAVVRTSTPVSASDGLPMGLVTMHRPLRHIGLHAAAALMTLMAIACLAAGAAAATVIGGPLALPVAAAAALATFQALRVPVGRAATWMLDR